MLLYADEDFSYPVVVELRTIGHDVVTAQEDSYRNASDATILARAHSLDRTVLTFNRRHFGKLHLIGALHSGILSATHDDDVVGLAARIDVVLNATAPERWHIRVNRTP